MDGRDPLVIPEKNKNAIFKNNFKINPLFKKKKKNERRPT